MKTSLKRLYNYIGWIRAKKFKYKENKIMFEDQLSIVSIAKYEETYIKEWIEYHLLQGIDRIYLYDNESPDRMKEVLQPYIASGKVVYQLIRGRGRQLDAYNDAVSKYKNKTKYMAFIDIDEFLVQEDSTKTILQSLEEIFSKNPQGGGIAVNWRVYGSSGFLNKPEGLVIENYVYRSQCHERGNDCVKTIANPRVIKVYGHDHYPTYFKGFYNINEEGNFVEAWSNPCGETKYIRINHYFTKSKEEWILRRSRGKADTTDSNDKRSIEEFYEHDKNEVYDDIIKKYVGEVKKRVNV